LQEMSESEIVELDVGFDTEEKEKFPKEKFLKRKGGSEPEKIGEGNGE
jgi:hypothetical protein